MESYWSSFLNACVKTETKTWCSSCTSMARALAQLKALLPQLQKSIFGTCAFPFLKKKYKPP
jgi:hypothetical protein